MCQGQKLARIESHILIAEQKKHLDTENTALSTGAQWCLRTSHCPLDHLPGAQPGGGWHLGQTPRNFTRIFLTSILKSTWLSFSEANNGVHIQCSSVLGDFFIYLSHAGQVLLKTSCRLTSCRWLCFAWLLPLQWGGQREEEATEEAAFHPQADLPWGRCRRAVAWERREVVGARMALWLSQINGRVLSHQFFTVTLFVWKHTHSRNCCLTMCDLYRCTSLEIFP